MAGVGVKVRFTIKLLLVQGNINRLSWFLPHSTSCRQMLSELCAHSPGEVCWLLPTHFCRCKTKFSLTTASGTSLSISSVDIGTIQERRLIPKEPVVLSSNRRVSVRKRISAAISQPTVDAILAWQDVIQLESLRRQWCPKHRLRLCIHPPPSASTSVVAGLSSRLWSNIRTKTNGTNRSTLPSSCGSDDPHTRCSSNNASSIYHENPGFIYQLSECDRCPQTPSKGSSKKKTNLHRDWHRSRPKEDRRKTEAHPNQIKGDR